ncbi:MAG: NUDIX hydrolase [Dissulfurispiraceae bacterium]
MKPATIRYLYSSGGVIFRRLDDHFDVALIATKNRTVWTLPKGIIDKDESAEMAAVREIQEETGLTGSIVERLGDKSYWFYLKDENAKCKKTVAYFLLKHVSGETNNFSWEVDEAGWFPLDEAIEMLHYKSDKEILTNAKVKLTQPE